MRYPSRQSIGIAFLLLCVGSTVISAQDLIAPAPDASTPEVPTFPDAPITPIIAEPPVAPTCEYNSFLDALPGGIFADTSMFKLAVKLSGYADKLPPPDSALAVTLLVPSNKAFLSLLWNNGFFIPILTKVGKKLPGTMLYNVLVGSLSPETINKATEAAPGTAPTAFALLGGANDGKDYSLKYWATAENTESTIYTFKPQINGGSASSGKPIQACNSWIYVTNKVLVPTDNEKLDGVQELVLPENLPWESNNEPPAEPVPEAPAATNPACVIPNNTPTVPPPTTGDAVAATPEVAPVLPEVPPVLFAPEAAPAACATTFADAAKANGLSILATAIGQPAIGSRLPDPASANTIFAPTDAAFLSMLTTLNISVTDALSLGDRLAGVILYHVHPDEAIGVQEIRTRTNLTTALGPALGSPDAYIIVVDAVGTDTLLKGVRIGNVAKITQELDVCGAKVLVIDQVLLPADGVQNLPDPGPAGTTTLRSSSSVRVAETTSGDVVGDSLEMIAGALDGSEAGLSLPAGIIDSGLAAGIGSFVNCTVELLAAGTKLTTTTDDSGRFSFPGVPECALEDAVVVLPAGLSQLASCVDKATGLPPPYTLQTLLSKFIGGNSTLGSSTPENPINLSPLTSLLSSGIFGGDVNTDALGDITQDLIGALGFDNGSSAIFGDFFDGLLGGSTDALVSATTNAVTLITDAIGGETLSKLIPGIDLDAAVKAINNVLNGDLSKILSLTDDSAVQGLLQQAFGALQSGLGGDAGSIVGDLLGGGLARKMLQQTPPEVDTENIFAAVAKPLALLNRMARDQAASEASETLTPEQMANLMSRCTRVAQQRVAPAAGELASGAITVEQFGSAFGAQKVMTAVSTEQTPGMNDTSAPGPMAKPTLVPVAKTPAPAPSSGASAQAGFVGATMMMLATVAFMI